MRESIYLEYGDNSLADEVYDIFQNIHIVQRPSYKGVFVQRLNVINSTNLYNEIQQHFPDSTLTEEGCVWVRSGRKNN